MCNIPEQEIKYIKMKASVRTECLSFVVIKVMQEKLGVTGKTKQLQWKDNSRSLTLHITGMYLWMLFSNVGRWLVEVCCGLMVLEKRGHERVSQIN